MSDEQLEQLKAAALVCFGLAIWIVCWTLAAGV